MMTRTECAAWLKDHDRFLIITHARPDGDTVGSAAAFCLGLRKLGKTAHVLKNAEFTPRYAPLVADMIQDVPREGDTLVCVDVASRKMLPGAWEHLADSVCLRIDHHHSSDHFTREALVDPACAACGEIIYDLLTELALALDKRIGEALYTAVSTDTGCFRFANTTAHTHMVAAACMVAGAEVYPINQDLFDTNSLRKLRLQGWIAENTRFYSEGRLAVCAIPGRLERELGLREDDTENLAGFTRSIEGVCMAATVRETEGGVKISVRSVPGYDASLVCNRFGGGGHKQASGAKCNLSLEDAAQQIAQVMLELEGA